MVASEQGRYEVVEVLVQRGADVEKREEVWEKITLKLTPLSVDASEGT